MIQIKALLEERKLYPVTKDSDSWLEKILDDEPKDDVWIITVSDSLLKAEKSKGREMLMKKYFVAGVYNLGTPFVDIKVRMELLHLTKEHLGKMATSIYKGQIFISGFKQNKNEDDRFVISDRYASKYERYLAELESWINGGNIPNDDINSEYEFNYVPISEISEGRIEPDYYSKRAVKVRKFIQNEKTYKLKSLVDIVMPRPVEGKFGKVVGVDDLKYPFNIIGISERRITNILLQKNDILFPTVGSVKPFLVSDDVNESIYVSEHIFVLRCREIQPQYLFLYLNSEVCKTIIDFKKTGSAFQIVTRNAIADIPIIKPTKDKKEYQIQADVLTHIEERSYQTGYESLSRLMRYYNALQKIYKKKTENVEEILEMEILDTLKIYSTNQLQKMLYDDWKELNKCFRMKAYKATLILAGSILEAVLIDWLSEIKGHDYFTEDYIVKCRNGTEKRADLIDYINEINYIERPYWNETAIKAHEIRKKRNLVHAKLGINSDEVNEETCRKVIDWLSDICKSRGVDE